MFALAIGSALAMGFAVMAAPQPAQALSAIDGQWTVVHGGTGQVTLNTDGTYTSTCEVNPAYADAWCPSPAGTFQYSTMSTASVTFTGTDGSTHSYRVSGLVSSPDTITSMFGSRTYSPLVMKKGSQFVCTLWSGTGTSFTRWGISPELEYDAAADMLYATGSHDLVGPNNIDTQVNLAETAPNYFQNGTSCPPVQPQPTVLIDNAIDASIPASVAGQWLPQATVTIKNAAGGPVAGATVGGTFTYSLGNTCVTVADGTRTISAQSTVSNSTADSSFHANSLTKDGMQWDGHGVIITVYRPTAPAPATHHIGDLDNATAATSSSKWQPKVTATVLDASGVAVAGATVSGTFSSYKGTLTCVTAANGMCTLGNFSLSGRTSSTVFTVTNVVVDSSTYAPTANSDPDGDSNGTAITINRP